MSSPSPSRRGLCWLAIGLLCFLGCSHAAATPTPTPRTPRESFLAEVQKRIGKEQTPEEWSLLVRQGLARLDDASIVRRALFTHQLLERVDEPLCARFAREWMNESLLLDPLERLPVEDQKAWFAISLAALKAELAKTPPPDPDLKNIGGLVGVFTVLGDALEMLMGMFDDTQPQSPTKPTGDTRACKTIQKAYGMVAAAKMPLQAIMARALVVGPGIATGGAER